MLRKRALPQCAALALLAGCGQSTNSPTSGSPAAAVKPDITVTVDAAHHACVVSKFSEPTGSTLGCADVVPFIRDELRVRDGSSYELRCLGSVDTAENNKVKAALDGAGFRYVGGLSGSSQP
jgi:hypothetical protein